MVPGNVRYFPADGAQRLTEYILKAAAWCTGKHHPQTGIGMCQSLETALWVEP